MSWENVLKVAYPKRPFGSKQYRKILEEKRKIRRELENKYHGDYSKYVNLSPKNKQFLENEEKMKQEEKIALKEVNEKLKELDRKVKEYYANVEGDKR